MFTVTVFEHAPRRQAHRMTALERARYGLPEEGSRLRFRDAHWVRVACITAAHHMTRVLVAVGIEPSPEQIAYTRDAVAEQLAAEAATLARLQRLIPEGSVTGAPARGRPHRYPLRDRRFVGEVEGAPTLIG